jgi:short subunit dehydrogenase-like uncharacterized protein
MIYGANGYTGRLIVAAALERGLTPVLAGRDARAVAGLARPAGLETRAFGLQRAEDVRAALEGIGLVLHCAGPFSATCAPMLEGCLAAGAHYLDITGEIDVFAHCHAQDGRARARGVVVLPGAGFDVVPTDCVAALLKEALPDAVALVLAFEAGGGVSRGTTRTSIEGLAKGGRVRRDGRLVEVPLAWKTRTFERHGKPRLAMTIPWGDVYTAHVTTGIPDVEVYMAVPPAAVAAVRRLRLVRPLLRLGPVQRFLQARADRRPPGPDAALRSASGCHVWGEARNGAGREAKLELDTPNGYALTASAALGIVERLLRERVAGGFYTPSRLMGARYVLGLPGVSLTTPPPSRTA